LLPSLPRRAANPRFLLEEIAYITGGPVLTMAETFSAGACDTSERLKKAGKIGVLLGAILFELDDFIPIDRVEADSKHLFHDFHRFLDPNARHTAPQDDPGGVAEAYIQQKTRLLTRGINKDPVSDIKFAA
jgi:hypothetical protein